MMRPALRAVSRRGTIGFLQLILLTLLLTQSAFANSTPIAQDDEVSTGAAAPILIEVLANDSDPDNDPIRLISGNPVSNGPTNGSASRLNDTIIRFIPNAGFRGLEQFRYRMTDGVAEASAWVSVHVDNRPPVAVGDFSDIDDASTVDINVLANDSDPDGDPVQRIESAATPQPVHGSVTWMSNAIARYTPAPGFTGNDSFRYYVTDGLGGEASALVFVNVSYANHPPVAVDDNGIIVDDGLPKRFNPLINDSDPNGDPIRLDPSQPFAALPAHGTVVVIDDHTLEYTPDPTISGADTFDYRITDGAFTAVASVTLDLGGNQPPIAVEDRRGTAVETPRSIDVIANDWDPDGDPIRLIGGNPVVTPPANGTATRLSDTTIRYTPNPGFQGTDQFRYQIIDGLPGGAATAWVRIGVGNHAPIATNDTAAAPASGSIVIDVVANDGDEDGDTLMLPLATSLPQPTHGSRLRVNNTSFRYFPNAGFVGSDSFQYEVEDSWGARDVGTVSITVSANQPPVAVGDQMFTEVDRPVTRNVVANDSDPDGDPIALTRIVGGPSHGQAVVVDSTSIRFEPDPGFTGNDTFTYEIADDTGATATAVVNVGIAAVPAPTVTGLMDSTPVLRGERKIVIFQGTDFHGAQVGIATAAFEDGDPPRVFPGVELVGISQSGTRLSVRVDAQASGVEGFYNIAIETPGGMTAGQVRVVGPEPVIDIWTPSEPVLGRVHVLQILGENLGGADVVPMHPGVRILDVDNTESKSLSGLMFVSSSASSGGFDLRIEGEGGSTILPMILQPGIPLTSRHTEELPVRNSAPGELVPSILLQEPISAFSPTELRSQLGFQPDGETRSAITSEERASLKNGTFCFTARAIQGYSYDAIRFSLLDDIGDPLTIEAINALLPGQSLDFNSLTIALTGFIRFEFSYQFCSNGISDLRICTTGGITGMVPAIGGWHFGFNFCFGGGGGFRTVLAGSGAINNHGYTSSNACVRASDAEPPGFPAGERRGTLSVDCCQNATIGLQSSGVVFDGTFAVQGPILQTELACVPPEPIQLSVSEVKFLDDLPVKRDVVGSADAVPPDQPEWKDTDLDGIPDVANNTIAYVRGRTVRARIRLSAATLPAQPVTLRVRATSSAGITLESNDVTFNDAETEVVLQSTMSLDNRTQSYDPLAFTWTYTLDGGATVHAGQTEHPFYVTLAPPITGTKRHLTATALRLGVGTGGATDQATAASDALQSFQGPANIRTWDGRPLYYYPQGKGFASCQRNALGILTSASGAGQCGAFAHLLMDALAVHGIPSTFVTVLPLNGGGFLVANWLYGSPTYPDTDFPYLIEMVNEGGIGQPGMVPLPADRLFGDLESLPGIAGQNSPTPSEKVFTRHFIVRIGIPPLAPYYDPSYGQTFQSELDFQTRSIDGIRTRVISDPLFEYRVRPPIGLEIQFIP